jgi:Ca2+-binding RTX toxin-like protein
LLTGDAGSNRLDGGDGNDTLNGGAGDDAIYGGNGADLINGGTGNDSMDGGAGNDTFVIEVGSKTVAGDAGLDSFQFVQAGFGTITIADFEDGNEKLDFTSIVNPLYAASNLDIQQIGANVQIRFVDPTTHVALPDTVLLQGESAASITKDDMLFRNVITTITGTAGDDHLVGTAGVDLIQGLAGNDVLDGAAGSDTLDGGAGNDTALFTVTGDVTVDLGTGLAHVGADIDTLISIENVSTGAGNDQITGSAGDNVLGGGAGNDMLIGGAGNDTLLGGSGDDTLNGDAGDDTLFGGVGSNVLNGGAGINTVSYADFQRAVSVKLSTGTASLESADPDPAFAMHDVLQNINNVIGSDFSDYILGNNTDNVLIGGAGNDILIGGRGNNVLTGGSGVDQLYGGFDDDTYFMDEDDLGDFISEVANEGTFAYDNVIILAVGDRAGTTLNYTAPLNVEGLTYEGNANFNGRGYDVTGSSGNDILNAAHAASGGAGNDILAGQADTAFYSGGDGFDYIDFGINGMPYAEPWTINLVTGRSTNAFVFSDGVITGIEGVRGSINKDILLGDDNANVLDGRDGNDEINGGGGDDTVIGGNGNDFLDGGPGNDTLIGGAGNDLFVFTPGAGTGDIIQDFQTVHLGLPEFDKVDLTGYGHGALITATLDALGTGTIVTVSGAGHVDSFTVLGVHPAIFDQSDMILA